MNIPTIDPERSINEQIALEVSKTNLILQMAGNLAQGPAVEICDAEGIALLATEIVDSIISRSEARIRALRQSVQ